MVAYSFKERFIKPIRVGLSRVRLSFDPPPKLQTIRAHGKRRHARPGEAVQLYYAMRTKQCQLIGVGICTEAVGIRIDFGEDFDIVSIEGQPPFGGVPADIRKLDAFATRDGFKSWDDLTRFWETEHPGVKNFEGVLIKWEPSTGDTA